MIILRRSTRAFRACLPDILAFSELQSSREPFCSAFPPRSSSSYRFTGAARNTVIAKPRFSTGSCRQVPEERHPSQKEADILETAERIFASDPTMTDQEEVPSGGATHSALEQATQQHSKHTEMHATRRKWSNYDKTEGLGMWLSKHAENLIPFRSFLRHHRIDENRAIGSLFPYGRRGRELMLPRAAMATFEKKFSRKSRRENSSEYEELPKDGTAPNPSPLEPWDRAFASWSDALAGQELPHALPELLMRWPPLLAMDPSHLPGTMTILRETLQDDDLLNEIIASAPRVLTQEPMGLQKRLITLQMACAGDLLHLLPKLPQLLYHRLDDVLAKIRILREHSRTVQDFRRLISYKPEAVLIPHPQKLLSNVNATKQTLSDFLPATVDPMQIIRCMPHLITIPPYALRSRWSSLQDTIESVPKWKKEMQELIIDASLAPRITRSADGAAAEPPEWVHTAWGSPGDAPVGIEVSLKGREATASGGKAPQRESSDDTNQQNSDVFVSDEGSAEVHNGGDGMDEDFPGLWGCMTLSEILWLPKYRAERLSYLVDQVPEKAGDVSFADALLVSKARFVTRFPEFVEWSEEQSNVVNVIT